MWNQIFLEAAIGVFGGDFADFTHLQELRAGAQFVQQVVVVPFTQQALEQEDTKLVPRRVAMSSPSFVGFLQL